MEPRLNKSSWLSVCRWGILCRWRAGTCQSRPDTRPLRRRQGARKTRSIFVSFDAWLRRPVSWHGDTANKAIAGIRLRARSAPWWVTLTIGRRRVGGGMESLLRVILTIRPLSNVRYNPLGANIASSTKPEVISNLNSDLKYITYCSVVKGATATCNMRSLDMFLRYASRETDIQIRSSQHFAPLTNNNAHCSIHYHKQQLWA